MLKHTRRSVRTQPHLDPAGRPAANLATCRRSASAMPSKRSSGMSTRSESGERIKNINWQPEPETQKRDCPPSICVHDCPRQRHTSAACPVASGRDCQGDGGSGPPRREWATAEAVAARDLAQFAVEAEAGELRQANAVRRSQADRRGGPDAAVSAVPCNLPARTRRPGRRRRKSWRRQHRTRGTSRQHGEAYPEAASGAARSRCTASPIRPVSGAPDAVRRLAGRSLASTWCGRQRRAWCRPVTGADGWRLDPERHPAANLRAVTAGGGAGRADPHRIDPSGRFPPTTMTSPVVHARRCHQEPSGPEPPE